MSGLCATAAVVIFVMEKRMRRCKTRYLQELEDRFLRYVRIDTVSDEAADSTPSTLQQYDLLNLLREELTEIGASDVTLTDYGCLLATIPATALDTTYPLWPF